MTRTRLLALGLTALLALTACGATPPAAATGPAAAPEPSASAPAARRDKGDGLRRFLKKNTLHGEITVQRKAGVETIVVQRGQVTAVDGASLSVKSADGFTRTWTRDDRTRVRQDRRTADPGAIKAGSQVGVAGTGATARLIVLG
jgi:hypothetical protein